jgi:hypothetical protein
MDVTARQDFTPTLNVQRTYNLYFPMEIAAADSLGAKLHQIHLHSIMFFVQLGIN